MGCDLHCFDCTYPDCINDGELDNAIKCKSWYNRNREKKCAYQRAYNKQKRQNKPPKKVKAIEVPKETKLLKFSEIGAILDAQIS